MTPATATRPIPKFLKNRAVQRFLESTSGLIGLGITIFIMLAALLAPVLNPYDPASDRNYAARLQGPSLEHWFGADGLGRDILTLVWYGLRTSLVIGLVSVLIGLLIGVALGLSAGYFRGWIETVIGCNASVSINFACDRSCYRHWSQRRQRYVCRRYCPNSQIYTPHPQYGAFLKRARICPNRAGLWC